MFLLRAKATTTIDHPSFIKRHQYVIKYGVIKEIIILYLT